MNSIEERRPPHLLCSECVKPLIQEKKGTVCPLTVHVRLKSVTRIVYRLKNMMPEKYAQPLSTPKQMCITQINMSQNGPICRYIQNNVILFLHAI